MVVLGLCLYLFFNDTATPEIYTYLHTLSLHDALPICLQVGKTRSLGQRSWSRQSSRQVPASGKRRTRSPRRTAAFSKPTWRSRSRSEEHTSELQSLMRISYAVFCLKKKNNNTILYKRNKL